MGMEVFYIEVWKNAHPGVGGRAAALKQSIPQSGGGPQTEISAVTSYLRLWARRLQFQNKFRASASGLLSGQSCLTPVEGAVPIAGLIGWAPAARGGRK